MGDITLDKLAEMVQKGFAEVHAEFEHNNTKFDEVLDRIRSAESHLHARIDALDVRPQVDDHEDRLIRVERKLGIRE